jgi:hypothetical protein
MARAGLWVGALPVLTIRGERYTTVSKGKEQAGIIPRFHEAGRLPSESLMSDSPRVMREACQQEDPPPSNF